MVKSIKAPMCTEDPKEATSWGTGLPVPLPLAILTAVSLPTIRYPDVMILPLTSNLWSGVELERPKLPESSKVNTSVPWASPVNSTPSVRFSIIKAFWPGCPTPPLSVAPIAQLRSPPEPKSSWKPKPLVIGWTHCGWSM